MAFEDDPLTTDRLGEPNAERRSGHTKLVYDKAERRIVAVAVTHSPPLPDEALIAIKVEHERDHDDGPNESRDGCVGCRMLAEIDRLREDLAAAHEIGDSFWAALKRLNLAALRVTDPGSHFTDAITARDIVIASLTARLAGQDREIGDLMVSRDDANESAAGYAYNLEQYQKQTERLTARLAKAEDVIAEARKLNGAISSDRRGLWLNTGGDIRVALQRIAESLAAYDAAQAGETDD